MDIDLNHLLGHNTGLLLNGPVFYRIVPAADTNEGIRLSVANPPDLLRSQVGKPLFSSLRQISNTLILAGGYYHVVLWYYVPDEALEDLRRVEGIEDSGELDFTGEWVENDKVDPSIVAQFILLNVHLFSIYRDLGEIAGYIASRGGLYNEHGLVVDLLLNNTSIGSGIGKPI